MPRKGITGHDEWVITEALATALVALVCFHRNTNHAHDAWVLIPGKHSGLDAAWDALENMIATRH
jgi:hypothetical protein